MSNPHEPNSSPRWVVGVTRNVVLVVLDTVRKDYFDEHAPRLRQASDVSFEQCRAASSWSVPSHASIFTEQLPSEHGLHAESFDSSSSFATLAGETILDDFEDHHRLGLSANSYLNPAFGFDALFDEFHDFSIGSHTAESLFTEGISVQQFMKATDEPSAVRRYLDFLRACLSHERPLKSVANGVWSQAGPTVKSLPVPEVVDDGAGVISRTMRERVPDTEPCFAFVNFMDAHTPLRNLIQHDRSRHSVPNGWSSRELDKWELNYDGKATPAYTQNYRDVYAAAIDYLDRIVMNLVTALVSETDRETSVVITADHGHNLGYEADDGLFHHTSSMTESVLHTPCEVINPPGGWPRRETRYLSHLALGELLRRLAADQPFDDGLVGAPVAAETIGLLGGDTANWGREFTDEEYAYWNRMTRCLYEGDRKVAWNSLGECVEYRLDPERPSWQERAGETTVPDDDAEFFETELETYKREASAGQQDMDFDEDVEGQLKHLGYL